MKDSSALDSQEELHVFLSHLKAGRKQQANEVLKRILQADPSKAAPYALLIGGMLAQNNQYREAIPLYQEAITLNPANPVAYFYLGVAYHALKDEKQCEQIWDQLAARFPNHATDYYQKGLRLLKTNQFGEAKERLAQAVKLLEQDNPLRQDASKTIEVIDRHLQAGASDTR